MEWSIGWNSGHFNELGQWSLWSELKFNHLAVGFARTNWSDDDIEGE